MKKKKRSSKKKVEISRQNKNKVTTHKKTFNIMRKTLQAKYKYIKHIH